jgi:hypothetical protein
MQEIVNKERKVVWERNAIFLESHLGSETKYKEKAPTSKVRKYSGGLKGQT